MATSTPTQWHNVRKGRLAYRSHEANKASKPHQPTSLLASLPAELRAGIYAYLTRVDLSLVARTCRFLRFDAPASHRLSKGERRQAQMVVLSGDALLYPDASRAICATCFDFHPLQCFLAQELKMPYGSRECKMDACVRLSKHGNLTLRSLRFDVRHNSRALHRGERFCVEHLWCRYPSPSCHWPCFIDCECDKHTDHCIGKEGTGDLVLVGQHKHPMPSLDRDHTSAWKNALSQGGLPYCAHLRSSSESVLDLIERLAKSYRSKRGRSQTAKADGEISFEVRCFGSDCGTSLRLWLAEGFVHLKIRRNLGPLEQVLHGDIASNIRWLALIDEHAASSQCRFARA